MITKRERFEKVAVDRTNRIINTIRLLGNCSNKNNYEYSIEDVKKIFAAIEHELRKTKNKFYGNNPEDKRFSL